MLPIYLLIASNLFMTVAWYGHLKFGHIDLWKVVLVSWGIAFFEYCLQVPANRLGYQTYSATQLKIIQEAISITVFVGFGYYILNESLTWRSALAFGLIFVAVLLAVSDRKQTGEDTASESNIQTPTKKAPE